LQVGTGQSPFADTPGYSGSINVGKRHCSVTTFM